MIVEHPFAAGQKVKIDDTLCSQLEAIGMDHVEAAEFHAVWAGKTCEVLATWSDNETHWVTVDLCCEVPAQCCQLA